MKHKSGFTLVELAIVLVIIGLIVGGVLVGRDLIRTAELRAILSDIEKYQTAVGTFRNKYNAIPGDMRNATDFWAAADADPSQCEAAIAGGIPTCNGDGNGYIALDVEIYTFWQQLSNAGLIGFSSGGAVADGDVPGVTVPTASSMKDIGYGVTVIDPTAMPDDVFTMSYGNVIATISANLRPLTTADAKWLDEKKDDGLPATGMVIGLKGGGAPATINPNCTTTAVATTSEYDLSVGDPECALLFRRLF